MYEQNEVPVFRRFLWIALCFIAAIVVTWVLVWLIFFRSSTPKPANTTVKPRSSQSTKTPSSPSNSSPSNTSDSNPSQPGTVAAPGASSTTTPTELVNTGAGDLVVPFVGATIIGGGLYYLRLRRKVLA